jgi:hypothetical protein
MRQPSEPTGRIFAGPGGDGGGGGGAGIGEGAGDGGTAVVGAGCGGAALVGSVGAVVLPATLGLSPLPHAASRVEATNVISTCSAARRRVFTSCVVGALAERGTGKSFMSNILPPE